LSLTVVLADGTVIKLDRDHEKVLRDTT
jgi:hypothetical protein